MFEIERKFLVVNNSWRSDVEPIEITQGYLKFSDGVRVRVYNKSKAELTIKGRPINYSRLEFNFPIPLDDANNILSMMCEFIVHKDRFEIYYFNKLWQVDVFKDDLSGLVMAEIELGSEEEEFKKPPWLGREVSHDERFYNFSLAKYGIIKEGLGE